MNSFRRFLNDLDPQSFDINLWRLKMRRLVLPGGSRSVMSGLFSLSESRPLGWYVGRIPESWTIANFLVRHDVDNLFEEWEFSRDIAAILSFVYHRRVVVADETPVSLEGQPETTFLPIPQAVDSRLYCPVTIDGVRVHDVLSELLSIAQTDQFDAISNAIRLYHSAACVADVDYGSAYLLLISAIDALANTFQPGPENFNEWSESRSWNRWIAQADLSMEASEDLRSRLLKPRHVQLKQRFVDLATKAATPEFWAMPWESCVPELELGGEAGSRLRGIQVLVDQHQTPAAIPADRLRHLLSVAYDQRSSFAHAGSRFPLDASLDHPRELELDRGKNRSKVAIPTFAWFERLTHSAITFCIAATTKRKDFVLPDFKLSPATVSP